MNATETIIAVYCASSASLAPEYYEAARETGRLLALRGAAVVNGGGKMGLMAAVSDGALEAGGTAIGVIPQFMVGNGWHHSGLTRLDVVSGMHERKASMASMATAAIALPGGIGTFEELTEIITLRLLGLYDGNIVILNLNGYYDPLLQMFERAIGEHFMKPDHRQLWSVASTPDEAVRMALEPCTVHKFTQKF